LVGAVGVVAVLAAVVALGGLAEAQSGSDSLAEFVWPGEGQRSSSELATLGGSLFVNGTDPTVIGERPVESLRLERVNDTTTRVLVGKQGGEDHDILQRHESNPATGPTHLDIPPGDLKPVVEVRGKIEYKQEGLRIYGPPGSFQLDGGSLTGRC